MFAEQRQERILHLLEEYKQVEVSSLTSVLSASEATIRRDLEKLEKMGLLHRTHGGAILAERESPVLQAITKKPEPLAEDYARIGEVGARMVAPGEVVALGAGPLGLSMARQLPGDLACTIVTNDAMILAELAGRKEAHVIMVGGMSHKSGDTIFTTGEAALRMLGEINVHKAFLSADGISEEAGITIRDFDYALIWKKFISIAQETVILALPEAFGKRELVSLIPMLEASRYITSSAVDNKYKKALFEQSIPIHFGFDM